MMCAGAQAPLAQNDGMMECWNIGMVEGGWILKTIEVDRFSVAEKLPIKDHILFSFEV